MAFDSLNIVDTTYSGTYAPYFIRRATYSMDTVEKGCVFVQGDIKKQHTIDRLDIQNALSPRQTNPTDNGLNPFTVDGRLMVPQDLQVYREFNPRNLELNQLAEKLSETILAREVPVSFQDAMVMALMERTGESLENGLWVGSTQYLGIAQPQSAQYQVQYFNGFIQMFVNDPLINLSSISPVTITSLNVTTIMDDLITQATTKVKALITDKKRYERMKFLMSPTTCNLYEQFITTGTAYKGNPLDAGMDVSYATPWKKYPVVPLAGMPDNTIIFCRAIDDPMYGNLYVGMNSQQDWSLRIQRVNAANELFFILGKWKYTVQYGWGQEIFMYTTLTKNSFILS